MPATMFSKRVGDYLLGRTLGEGTYAKVKYGQHRRSGEAVAIKILDKSQLEADDMVEQIKTEITILKHLKHRNVVDLKEVMASEEKIYMVMELVPGGELFDKIVAEGCMNEAQARKVMHELMDALSYCHAQGIYHRDLKPENVLLAEDGSAKLSDFGLGALPNSVNTENGKLMTTCGTPNYVAPEVLAKKGYEGAPADIWSLGVVLYVVLAGCLPFDEPTLPGLFKQIITANYQVPPWFSPQVCALLERMLCVDTEERITLGELQREAWVVEGGYTPALGSMTPIGEQEAQDIFESNTVNQEDVSPSQLDLAASVNINEKSSRQNAFMLISAAIDLSGMFDLRKDVIVRHTRFTTRAEIPVIMEALSRATADMGGEAETREEHRLKLTFKTQKGGVVAHSEIFQVLVGSPPTHMVEITRNRGDHAEFYKLYNDLVERGTAIVASAGSSNSRVARFERVSSKKASDTASFSAGTK